MKGVVAVLLLLLSACGDGGSADLYARERALPAECRGKDISLHEARRLADSTLPTVPVSIALTDNDRHNTRRNPVTGVTNIDLVRSNVTTGRLAHELAHAAVFDAYSNKAPPDQPSTEKAVPMHGEEFVRAYKIMLRALVSPKCAGAL